MQRNPKAAGFEDLHNEKFLSGGVVEESPFVDNSVKDLGNLERKETIPTEDGFRGLNIYRVRVKMNSVTTPPANAVQPSDFQDASFLVGDVSLIETDPFDPVHSTYHPR